MKYLKPIIAGLWLWLMPIHSALTTIICLPLIDLAMALLAAKKAGRPIQSSGIKRTVAKVCMYEVATILAFVVETNLLGALVPVVKVVTGLIGMTELKSCLEHLDELNGQPFFASILTKMAPPKDPNEEP